MKKYFLLTLAMLVAVFGCQKVEMEGDPSFDAVSLSGTRASSFSSKFGINWDKVSKQSSTCAEPAFKSMQVTCDADNLYLLLTADPSKMTTSSSYDYANVLNVYLGNSSDTQSSYWAEKAENVSSMGGWLMKKGQPHFSSWGSGVDANPVNVNGTYYYEIKYPRTLSAKLQRSDVLVGVYMNNRYNVNGSNSSGYSTVGVRPNRGSNMYWLSLKNYIGVGEGSSSGSQSGSGSESGSGSSLISKTYSESSSDVSNPERGLYEQMDFVFKNGSFYYYSDAYSASSVSSAMAGFTEGTLLQINFWLKDYKNTSTLSDTAVSKIKEVLGLARSNGKKVILRFGYSDSGSSSEKPYDATPSRIKAHINTLKTVFDNYTDVIYLVQAGFIGAWGEGYYSTNFTTDQYTHHDYYIANSSGTRYEDWNYKSGTTTQVKDYGNRKSVYDALYSAVPSSRQIALRTPFHKRFYLYPTSIDTWTQLNRVSTGSKENRLAFHNDVLMIDDYREMDTFYFDVNRDRSMWKQQSAYLACGGETGSIDESSSSSAAYVSYKKSLTQDAVVKYMKDYHISYLHRHNGSYMYKWWSNKGWIPAIKKALGYRLWLKSFKVTGSSLSSGKTVNVSLTIKNSGSAPVINYRPMKLVLLSSSGTATVLKTAAGEESFGDIREILSGSEKTFTFDVTLPRTLASGDRIAIYMPDADLNGNGLYKKSVYSIRLANSSMDFVDRGYNIIYTK